MSDGAPPPAGPPTGSPPPAWPPPGSGPPAPPPYAVDRPGGGPPTGGPPTGGPPTGGPPPFPSTYAGWPAAPAFVPQAPEDPLVARGGFGAWSNKLLAAVGRSWRRLLPVFLVGAVPQAVLAVVIGVIIGDRPTDQIVRTELDADGRSVVHVDWGIARPVLIAAACSLVIGGILSALIRAAAVWVITHDAAGRPTTLGEALRFASGRFWRLVGWQLLFGVMTGVGLLLCIVPGVYVWVLSTFVVGIVSFEGDSVWDRARALLRGSFWAVFGRVITVTIVAGVAAQVVGIVGRVITSATGSSAVGGAVGAFLVAPIGMLAAASAVVTYAEAKARVDGTDTPNLLYDLHRP